MAVIQLFVVAHLHFSYVTVTSAATSSIENFSGFVVRVFNVVPKFIDIFVKLAA
jgi:hypothetical protein